MLRLSKAVVAGVGLAALLTSAAVFAQSGLGMMQAQPQQTKPRTGPQQSAAAPSTPTFNVFPVNADVEGPSVTLTAPTATGAPILPSWARDMLAAHNAARAAVGVPPLNWSFVLQAHATTRAGELAQVRQLVHASREGRGTERENLLSTPIGWSPGQIVAEWTKEGKYFIPGVFPNVCNTGGDCSAVWHYTQMIWSETTDIGCGMAPGGGFIWTVCRYDPGGNKDGKPVIADSPPLDSPTHAKAQEFESALLFFDYLDPYVAIMSYEPSYTQTDIDFTKSKNPKYCSASLIGGIAFNFGCNIPPPSNVLGVDDLLIPLPAGTKEVDTKVEQPKLGNQEVFKPAEPTEPLPDPL